MRILLSPLIALALLVGCKNAGGPYPSLQPRSVERIDPRLPVAPLSTPAPVTPALMAQLEDLIRQARTGDTAFTPAIARAEQLANAAGAPQSESWIVAQEALSAAIAVRGPTSRALGDADALAARQVEQRGTIAPADLAAIQAAAARISGMAGDQQRRIDAVARRLGA